MIPYSRQTIDKNDLKAVLKALQSDFLTTGPIIKKFENNFCRYVGSKYAVAVANGTAALHLACLAAGLSKNQELITSPLTFAASANCALYCGAKPIFADINHQGLIDENLIEERITKKTKIIIPVHYAGLPCHLAKIKKLAQKHHLIVIEDACHALGARYKKSKIGDCKYSDMTVFSFHPVKHITTGEGGMITTNSRKLYEKLLLLRNHGIAKEISISQPWYYEMRNLGFNYRITDLQCALGLSQLKKIERFIKKRRKIAKLYDLAFRNSKNIKIILEAKDQFNSYHLYPIQAENEKIRLKLFNYLRNQNIFCQVHYLPVYWHPYYQKLGYKRGICPRAEDFYKREVSIPLFPSMSGENIQYIIKIILGFSHV
ncbi:UDP-4-amino-4,6-dideoxy-N-acetyl-beta-L-altrosamine transaminase [Candidatus Beckwithbacteria bacterium RBG_13_42_9]|uniref:UDP-4-amino-4, 6-dideoxy-N-acetyl-beta-L-altrosamine transaminase n=1 Tax=Candidatus Beckwithbacteria bacterium RBG_13_42_9 TaxID=1797457 RepID=A0A1F5E7Q4_9BACT|nr:MAG: UDP-4-amino-4,6-dideoxy-N-acetyl-beta-L-altrosamine transaminase [Candidatus Beckwithbacteria bacterium RBG_13_42_9]